MSKKIKKKQLNKLIDEAVNKALNVMFEIRETEITTNEGKLYLTEIKPRIKFSHKSLRTITEQLEQGLTYYND